jgi:hypothetical protein
MPGLSQGIGWEIIIEVFVFASYKAIVAVMTFSDVDD